MKHIASFLIFCMATAAAVAQTVQPGIVKEYRGKERMTPLAGVELDINQANSQTSGKDGRFKLTFPYQKVGDPITYRSIKKKGYEVFNKEALNQRAISPKVQYEIVMCKTELLDSKRDKVRKVSTDSYERKALARLEKLKKDGRIKEQEYRDKLKEIYDNYQKQLDNLENYIDRFARINLSELSATEQEIIDLVHQGRIDEAIERYDNLNLVDKLLDGLKQKREISNAIDNLSELRQSQSQSNDSLYAMVKRQIETLQLQGDPANNRKIAKIYCDVADADTTNADWLEETGIYLQDYIADFELALEYYFKALDIRLNKLGEGHPDVATAYNNIGTAYADNGDIDMALEYFYKTLDIRLKKLGEEHPNVTDAYNNIGIAYYKKGDIDMALEYYFKALDIRLKKLGVEHPDVASAYYNIGIAYRSKGDLDKALEFYFKALDIWLKKLGDEHPYVALAYDNIGNAYADKGDVDNALEFYFKALNIKLKKLGDERPDVASTYNNIGNVYHLIGDANKALEYYFKALDIFTKAYGESHLNTQKVIKNINEVKQEMEDGKGI